MAPSPCSLTILFCSVTSWRKLDGQSKMTFHFIDLKCKTFSCHWQKMYQAPRFSLQNHQKESEPCFLLKKMLVSHLSNTDSNTLLLCNPGNRKVFSRLYLNKSVQLTILTSEIESKLAMVKSNPTYKGSPEIRLI